MNYLQFKECVLKKVEARICENEEIKLDNVTKNNNIVLDSITIVKKGFNVFPTLYFNNFFEEYKNGKTIDAIVDEIFYVSNYYTGKKEFMSNILDSFDNVKEHLACKLINLKLNQDLLEKTPYRVFLDLAIVVYCVLTKDGDGQSSVLITNEILKEWDISADELLDYALDNTPKLLGEEMFPITNLIECDSLKYNEQSIPLYILTNAYKYNGAICLMDDFALEDLASDLGSDLLIIPASVHEVLLAPSFLGPSKEDLDNLIAEVNNAELAPQDILSDHGYIYLREEKKIVF